MTRLLLSLSLALTIGTTAFGAAQAPITLTVKNFSALTNSAYQVIEAAAPGNGAPYLSDLEQKLGTDALKSMDPTQPWQIALWVQGIGVRPNASLRVPTKNFEAFKKAFEANPRYRSGDIEPQVERAGNYANIWLPGVLPSESAQQAHQAWSADQLQSLSGVARLQIKPGEDLRMQLLQGLSMMRMAIVGAMASQNQAALPGMDVEALGELMNVYFDVFQVGITGWDTATADIDLKGDALRIQEKLTAKPGSELQGWLQGGEGTLDSVKAYAQGDAPIAFAMRWNDAGGFMPTLKKFMRLSMKMQGLGDDEAALQKTEEMIDLMIPMQAAGTMTFEGGMNFSGIYQFPGREMDEVYQIMTDYVKTTMAGQAGEEKPYKAVEFTQGHAEIAGTRVDRLLIEYNLDSPLYQGPGQREMIESIFPGGKLVFDYAVKGDQLFIAGAGNLASLLQQQPTNAGTNLGPVGPATVLAMRLNILQLLPQFLATNPMVPAEAKAKFEQMNSKGTDIGLIINLDGTLGSHTTIPLQLLRSVGQSL